VNLSKNVVLPSALAVTLATALLGAAYSVGRSSNRDEATAVQVGKLAEALGAHTRHSEETHRELERALAATREGLGGRVAALEAHYSTISQSLGRLEGLFVARIPAPPSRVEHRP
jgi:hypothetical protein